jgi:tRNA-2-methylthio-N6-dimethylallyladenosine synthase
MGDILGLYIETFGCQMNKLDAELVCGNLIRYGYQIVDKPESADVILFETCSVRVHAEERVYSRVGALRSLKEKRPQLIIGIIGCMAQNHKEEIFLRLPHVELVVGPHRLSMIPTLVEEIRRSKRPRQLIDVDLGDEICLQDRTPLARPTPFKAYVRAIEGCDCSCSFCIVPKVRGKGVSRKPEQILKEVNQLADSGCVQITLLGQTINSYGRDLRPQTDLADLLEILSRVKGIRRIGFITSHPAFVTERLIEAVSSLPKVCKYLHLPVQSGSDRILRLMRRGYTAQRYLEVVSRFREQVPGIEITTDFIVGFPTEQESDFEESLKLMTRLRPQNSFIFKYSIRPGTQAARLPDDVPLEVKRRRNQMLLELQARISLERNRSKIGEVVEVLVEGESKSNKARWTGRTHAEQIVVFDKLDGTDLRGQFVPIRIKDATSLTLIGEMV